MFSSGSKNNFLYNQIIQQLYYEKVLSCSEFCPLIDKSFPIVNKALNYLIEGDFIIKKGHAVSSGGRRPLTYALNTSKLYIVTVAIDQLSTRIGICNLLNEYIAPVNITSMVLETDSNLLIMLTELINNCIVNSGIDKNNIIGIGIGMPGLIDHKKGINYTYLNAGAKTFTQYITDVVKLPVHIDNDSNLVALAELKFGKARNLKEAMVINFSWCIGLGLIINGHIYRGYDGFAGEFSHIPITENGELCSCGKLGCLQAEASLLTIIDKATESLKNGQRSSLQNNIKPGQTVMDKGMAIIEAAGNGDQFASQLISEAAYKIGRGMAMLIHIMNPRAIIISGYSALLERLLLAPIQQALNKHCIPRMVDNARIEISDIGANAQLLGAAILVIKNLNRKYN
jgi:predicted NBD/HSP70 family sugar kinase